MSPRSRLIVIWILVGGYAGVIFALSAISKLPAAQAWAIPHFDKLCHAIAYAALTLGLIYALTLTCMTRAVSRLLFMAVILAVCYGVVNELQQLFRPGRTMSSADIVANAVGAALVAWIWPRIQRRWPSAEPSGTEEGGMDHELKAATRVARRSSTLSAPNAKPGAHISARIASTRASSVINAASPPGKRKPERHRPPQAL